MKGFKNCYFDSFHSIIWLKEQDTDRWEKFDYSPWCYITPSSDAAATVKDIYKRPLMKFNYKDKSAIDGLKSSGIIVAESDLKPEVKFMHDRYDFETLKVDMNAWNICLFDIEVAGSSKYYDNHLIDIRSLDGKIHDKVELYVFDTTYDKTLYEVFDIEHNVWVKFNDSCFISYAFPAAEKADWPINLITCYSTKTKETYTWGLKPYTDDIVDVPNYIYCKDELTLMKTWLKWFNHQNFDIISGWNSVSYDIPYIINRCSKLRTLNNVSTEWERALSPLNKLPKAKQLSDRKLEGVDLGSSYDIPGLYSIDYMELYKTFGQHPPLPSYSLNYVSNLELSDSKLNYEGSINDTYKYDWNNFTKYNVKDVLLLVKLDNKLKLMNLLIQYAFDCIVTIDKTFNKIPTTTGYALKFLHNTGRVLNDRVSYDTDWWAEEECYKIKKPDGTIYYQNTEWENDNKEFLKFKIKERYYKNERSQALMSEINKYWKPKILPGNRIITAFQMFMTDFEEFTKWPHPFEKFNVKAGYCYDEPGRYDDNMSFDITSSYPHHIMQFCISPECVVRHPTKEQIESGEVILSDINEIGFRNDPDAILPNIVKQVFNERKEFKKLKEQAVEAGDTDAAEVYEALQMCKKLIINSVYGTCLANTYHLYSPECARAICRCARVTLRDWLSNSCNKYYVSTQLVKDLPKYFPTIKITIDNKVFVFNQSDKITVQRNNEIIEITANEFNIETDLLGIED